MSVILIGFPRRSLDVNLSASNRPRRTLDVVLSASNLPSRRVLDIELTATNLDQRQVLDVLLTANNIAGQTSLVQHSNGNAWKITTHATFGQTAIKQWSYSRSGAEPSMTVTFRGDYRAFRTSELRITVMAENLQTGATKAFSTERLVGNNAARYVRTPTGGETTLNFVSAAVEPANRPLPELVGWQLEDEELGTPYTPAAVRQAQRKHMFVRQLIGLVESTAQVKLRFKGQNPFEGQIIQKTSSDYSTEGKTLVQVLNDFYGKAGFELLFVDDELWVVEPFPAVSFTDFSAESGLTGMEISPVATTAYGRILLTGMPEEKTISELIDFATTPDQPHTQMEISDDYQLHSVTENPQGFTASGMEKVGGQVVRTGSLSVGEVRTKAPEGLTDSNGNPLPERVFSRVAQSVSNTVYHYLPQAPDVLRLTVETVKKWAYPWNINMGSRRAILEIPDYIVNVPCGYLLGSETTSTYFYYSAQGWLERKVTAYDRIGSIKATDLNGEDEEIAAGERNHMLTVEKWAPVGHGLWSYSRQTFGTNLTPTYDAESLGWVDVLPTTGLIESHSEITDQAPTHIQTAPLGGETSVQDQLLLVPREHELTVGDGTESLVVDFPTEKSTLSQLANILQTTVQRREQKDWRYAIPTHTRIRDLRDGYWITGISASGNGGAGFGLQVTGEKLL